MATMTTRTRVAAAADLPVDPQACDGLVSLRYQRPLEAASGRALGSRAAAAGTPSALRDVLSNVLV